MFGIGLPELILIMAVALIVVGPEKLPDLAKTIARQIVELKKTAGALKESFSEEVDEKNWQDQTAEYLPPGGVDAPSAVNQSSNHEPLSEHFDYVDPHGDAPDTPVDHAERDENASPSPPEDISEATVGQDGDNEGPGKDQEKSEEV